jgi:hypothetical protein
MPIEEIRSGLANRLRARREEIEQATLTRVYAISDPSEAPDPAYLDGLRAAVSAAIDYGLSGIESAGLAPPVPIALLAQSRLAARSGVSLDTVLRRYCAGYALLGDFLVQEIEHDGLAHATLQRLLRDQAGLLDQLVAAVSEEYNRELQQRPASLDRRRAELVEGLLAGELLDASELSYDFEGYHLGLVVAGSGALKAVRCLAAGLDCRLLTVRRDEGTVWAWFGSRRPVESAELEQLTPASLSSTLALAVGESAEGLDGWRFSHLQASAALPVALRSRGGAVRYAEVALLASILQDELLAASLRRLYLEPLERGRDGGKRALETLRAYFASGRNVSATAAALGMNRHTVASRLHAIEGKVGRPLRSCATDLETALHLDEVRPRPSANRFGASWWPKEPH